MIRINCTNCKAQLSIDDAFAGGVCRCQYCGTIQTVPKHLKSADANVGIAAAASATSAAPKALYKNKSRNGDGPVSSGLDAIADAIATSSGLSGSGLSNNQRHLGQGGADAPASPPRNRTLLILVACAVVIVLLLGVIVGVLIRGDNGGTPGPVAGGGGGGTPSVTNDPRTTAPPVPVSGGPNFLGQPLPESSVVFVIDHGDATRDSLEYLKFALQKSLRTLRKDQKFQVIFWQLDNQKSPTLIPKEPSPPTDAVLAATDVALGNVFAYRTSNPDSALAKAFSLKPPPGVVVIASGKPVGDDFAGVVMDARKDSTAKVHCFSLNAPASRASMSEVAKRTGGQYRNVSLDELQTIR